MLYFGLSSPNLRAGCLRRNVLWHQMVATPAFAGHRKDTVRGTSVRVRRIGFRYHFAEYPQAQRHQTLALKLEPDARCRAHFHLTSPWGDYRHPSQPSLQQPMGLGFGVTASTRLKRFKERLNWLRTTATKSLPGIARAGWTSSDQPLHAERQRLRCRKSQTHRAPSSLKTESTSPPSPRPRPIQASP